MRNFEIISNRIQSIFCEELQIDPPGVSEDLIDAGVLDSMMFVSLVAHLEAEFGMSVSLQEVEVTDFSTIEKITQLVVTKDGTRLAE
jgi:acyl carrier protein